MPPMVRNTANPLVALAATATPASALSTARFGCAFIHYECPHDAIFKPLYLRTNRTNHTKILRCFPHCCPGHRKRSYCGSSLFVHVQIVDSRDADQGILGDDVVVFARFRPDHAKPLAIGHRMPLTEIEGSLQSENPADGEWIECTRPSSAALTTSWIFKVNPSSRWFYPWSGAATIAMRATEHTLEVLAFRRRDAGQLELVARTASPPFRLMSFRRGAPSTQPNSVSNDNSPRMRRSSNPSYKRGTSHAQYARQHIERLDHSYYRQPPGVSSGSSLIQKMGRRRDSEYVTLSPDNQASVMPRMQTALSTGTDINTTGTSVMGPLLAWLQEIPANTIGPRWMQKWERIVLDACEAHVLASRTSHNNARAGLVPILSALSLSKPSLDASATPSTKTSPWDVIDTVVRLLLHVWLDLDCHRASITSIDRYVSDFDPSHAALTNAHSLWLDGVNARAQRFVLDDPRISWSHLQGIGVSHQPHTMAVQQADEFSFRSFVAQCRGRVADKSRTGKKRSTADEFTVKRRCTRVEVPTGLLASARVWTSRIEDVSIEMGGRSQHSLSLLTVVQFWKHLSCLRLDFSPGNNTMDAAQLSVASVFNSLVNDGSFTKLTLDGQYRWFNCLPSGEPTVGTTLMGYVVGDYVGRATSAGTVHITTYLWPSEASSSATAFAWHRTIDATSLASGSGSSSSVMSVVVESASVARTSYAMETMSMQEKLCCVSHWQHECELRLSYRC